MCLDGLFCSETSDDALLAGLSRMSFVKIGEGHAAHVFGDAGGRIVLKVFPPLRIGSSKEIRFIRRNRVLRRLERFSMEWERVRPVAWLRSKAKMLLAEVLSRKHVEARQRAGNRYIEGYRVCIDKGVMRELPTRIIPNWVPHLQVAASKHLLDYLARPTAIVMQRRFSQESVVAEVLGAKAKAGDSLGECCEVIEAAIDNEVRLWRLGVVDTDFRFNALESQVILFDGTLQFHDANNMSASWDKALWFVRAKENDLNDVIDKLDRGQYPRLLFDSEAGSIAEGARTLFRRLPADRRDTLVKHFLRCAHRTLREETLRGNWGGDGC